MSEISNVVCPKCRKIGGGFRKDLGGYVYVLLTKGNSSFTGYGITNHIASRMATHRRNLSRQGIEVEDWAYGVADGHTVAKIESFLKKNFPLDSQNIDGFRTEATHSYLFEYAVDAVHKLLSSLPYPVEPVPTPEVVSFVQSRLAALSEASKEPCSAEEMCSD
jgi:hypothetical protein